MASQNVRMHGPAPISTAIATKYTVPAGQIAVLQHIHVYNPSAQGVTFAMSIGTDVGTNRIYDGYTVGANQVLDVFCMYALNAGEVIQAFAGANNILLLTLDGKLQSTTPAGSTSAFKSIYEVDFRLLPTLSMQAAGSYSVDGKTWWAKGPVQNVGATYGVVNGSGLQLAYPGAITAPQMFWRTAGDVSWADRVLALPLNQLTGYNPEAPLAVLWRGTGIADAGTGEPGLICGLSNAASNTAALTAGEKAATVTLGYTGNGANSWFMTTPHNNTVNSQWNTNLSNPSIVPANQLDPLESGIYRVSTARYLPLMRHFDGALGNPNTAIEYTLDNAAAVRSGNGLSNNPCFIVVSHMPWSQSRTNNITHLKIMQPWT